MCLNNQYFKWLHSKKVRKWFIFWALCFLLKNPWHIILAEIKHKPFFTQHQTCSWTLWRGAVLYVFIYRQWVFESMVCSVMGQVMCFREAVSVKSAYCTSKTAALCIHYFPLHLAVIFVPNEITHKSPKVLTTQAAGPESQSSQGSI